MPSGSTGSRRNSATRKRSCWAEDAEAAQGSEGKRTSACMSDHSLWFTDYRAFFSAMREVFSAAVLSLKKNSGAVSRVLYCRGRGWSCHRRCLPFIYDTTLAVPLSFYPPARAGRPLSPLRPDDRSRRVAGLHELSTSGVHSTYVAIRLVGSYPTFSPLPKRFRRLFSSARASPRGLLPVR